MNQLQHNPFLEGSEEVPRDEAEAAAKALAEEAAAVRARTDEIKERAERARAEKEAATKEEAARLEAEVEAARTQVIKTVSSIPRASDDQTLRPDPPPFETLVSDVEGGSFDSIVNSAGQSESIPGLVVDFVAAAVAITFTIMLFNDVTAYLK